MKPRSDPRSDPRADPRSYFTMYELYRGQLDFCIDSYTLGLVSFNFYSNKANYHSLHQIYETNWLLTILWNNLADTSLEFRFCQPKAGFLLNIVLRASRVDTICAKNNLNQSRASNDPGEGKFWAENNSDPILRSVCLFLRGDEASVVLN